MAVLKFHQAYRGGNISDYDGYYGYRIDPSDKGWYLMDKGSGVIFGNFAGSGITYNSSGSPLLGSVTSATSLSASGAANWTVSNISYASNAVYDLLNPLETGNAFSSYMLNYVLDGNDTITGSAGNDVIYATTGSDKVNGGEGNDGMDFSTLPYYSAQALNVDLSAGTYSYSTGSATIKSTITNIENVVGSSRNDILTGSTADNVFVGGEGGDSINGAGGSDTIIYTNTTKVNVNLGTGLATEFYGAYYSYTDNLVSIENVIGSSFNDVIVGNGSNNKITGGAGNDTLDGGSGVDTADFSNSYRGVSANLQTGKATGQGTDTLSNFENITGSSYGDSLTGNAYANTLSGGDGNDILSGGAGTDVLYGGNGLDWAYYNTATSGVTLNLGLTTVQLTGGAGSDKVIDIENVLGSSYADTLTGSAVANMLKGAAGNDVLAGGGGNDILIGGAGKDLLSGNSGSDVFKFEVATESAKGVNRDVITDFVRGTDKIDLSLIDANVFVSGDQAFRLISSTSAFTAAGQMKLAGGVLYADATGDGVADFEIALTGVSTLSSSDFVL